MPRCFTARNAVVSLSILLLTALFLHLKTELWDRARAPVAGVDLLPLPDEPTTDRLHDNKKPQVFPGHASRRTAVVVASQASENASWLYEYFPDWEKNIYRVDDPSAPLTVPKNKGRESMVYLT